MANSWPGGFRHAMEQAEHEHWNATHYPGTEQLCSKCGEPTGRCEEDAIWSDDGEPSCVTCYRIQDDDQPPASGGKVGE